MIKIKSYRIFTTSGLYLVIVGIVIMALMVFKDTLASGVVLFSTDNGIGVERFLKSIIPGVFSGVWGDTELLGAGGGVLPIAWSYVLLWLSPLRLYMNWIHGLDLGLGTFFLVLFLRQRKLGWGAAALAGLCAFWVGSNLTLTYSGHTGKFAVMMLSAVALWLIERAVQTRKWEWSAMVGCAAGLMFNEQPDFALFVGLPIGAYMLYAAIREEAKLTGLARLFLPCLIVIVMIAGPGVIGSYLVNVKGVAAVSEEDPQAKWEFCTQWSLPPDESIDLIAPGYMGLRSGEPEGPYWGRTGRSVDWERTHQGFMNFRLDSIYLGAIPLVFALFAVVAASFGKSTDERKRRSDICFWAAAALISLLLSFGKYFPLYRLFYHLPMVNNVRNPIKFIQVFQLAAGILAAYGLDFAIKKRSALAP